MVITPYNSSTDLWFMYFQTKTGGYLTLIEMYGIRSIIALFALIFNLSLISPQFLPNTYSFGNFILALIGQPFIKFVPCFWIQILSIITGNNAQMTMVLIGLDRLFAVKLPICLVTCSSYDISRGSCIVAYSSNAPVLYFVSEKYRAAFNDCFPLLAYLNGSSSHSNSVGATATTPAIAVNPHLPKIVNNRPLTVINS
uniref:Serpentine receptor class gamma n=1 Tax=Meloidogyne javanica TaxID=6303 RepID=A0A915LC33_MELJA